MKKASILNDIAYQDGHKPYTTVLFVSEFSREIRMVFKKGQFMKEHRTPFPIVIEIIEGSIDFGIHGGTEKLAKGDIITLGGGIPHDLQATSESIVRLTISLMRTIDHDGNPINE